MTSSVFAVMEQVAADLRTFAAYHGRPTPVVGFRPCDRTWWVDPTGDTADESKQLGPFTTEIEAEIAAEALS